MKKRFTAEQVLARASQLHIILGVEGEKLVIHAPDEALNEKIRAVLSEYKPELVAYLKGQERAYLQKYEEGRSVLAAWIWTGITLYRRSQSPIQTIFTTASDITRRCSKRKGSAMSDQLGNCIYDLRMSGQAYDSYSKPLRRASEGLPRFSVDRKRG